MNSNVKMVSLVGNFFKEVQVEVKKVVWPSRRYVAAATGIVLVIVFSAGIFTWLIDLIFSKIMLYLMTAFGK